jgi:quinol monooxygenase YgiN
MICVIATIELAEGCREEFLAEFRKIVPDVLAEKGCLEYQPTVDVATEVGAQVAMRPLVVTVVEKWESVDALEAHLMAPHMMAYRKRVKEMVAHSSLVIVEPA